MQSFKLGMIAFAILLSVTETSIYAQVPGMSGVPSMGGMGGNMGRPKRKLHKSKAPVLSPALNLLPGASQSFEGQFLMRQLPQEQALKSFQQTGKALDTLQQEITQNDNQIKTGIRATGHRTSFMSYGNYYSFGGGRGGR